MSRLIDRILNEPIIPVAGDAHRAAWLGEFRAILARIPCVEASNVSEYLLREDAKKWAEAIPNGMLPFPEMWIEFNTRNPEEPRDTLGVYLSVREADWVRELWQQRGRGPFPRDAVGVGGLAFHQMDARRVHGPLGQCCYVVRPDGTLAGNPFSAIAPPAVSDPMAGAEVLHAAVYHALGVALMTVAFMHCKNVTVERHDPSPKLSKAHEKRHGRPLVRYHTLQIDPMKEVLRREGGSETNGLKKALHICRGHFATYTPEAPLFGRVTGTFWKPMHVRGSAKEGVVLKDYQIGEVAQTPTA